MGIKADLMGNRFGRLTVIAPLPPKNKSTRWLCKCDCGKEKEVLAVSLTQGRTISCGCYMREKNSKHNGYKSRLYKVWDEMLCRCRPNNGSISKNYGDRGIRVCDEWQDFGAFREWAYANGYDDSLTRKECSIDRIDVNGNYEPSNCRWVDAITQNRNRRDNHILTYKGESHCVTEWGEILGINKHTLFKRLHNGWSVEATLGTPVNKNLARNMGA